ncbi:MAG: homocysteine S-methyltransferase family protein [Pseudomonadota bacterium]
MTGPRYLFYSIGSVVIEVAHMHYAALSDRLEAGEVVILDGGTGTELERRGVKMSADAWCGPATLDNLDTLKAIHGDYIASGADIITANTYASSRLMMEPAGFGDRVQEANRAAVRVAIEARDASGRDDVLIAGSLSHMCPQVPGMSAADESRMPSDAAVADALAELATIHREEGCDLILLEMVFRPRHVDLLITAARESGLPVWCGFACRRSDDGRVLAFEPNREVPFVDVVMQAGAHKLDAAGVMHTPSNLIGDAIDILKDGYGGPLTAYPDSGYFKMPEWQFDDIIPPAELRSFADGWRQQGVQVFGGCCGLSPEHIRALSALKDT